MGHSWGMATARWLSEALLDKENLRSDSFLHRRQSLHHPKKFDGVVHEETRYFSKKKCSAPLGMGPKVFGSMERADPLGFAVFHSRFCLSGGCWTDAKDERTQWRHDTTLEDKMTRWKAGRSFLSLFSLQHVTLSSPFPQCLLCAVCVGSKRRQALGSWELEIATAVLGSSKEQKISKKREKRGSLQICDVGWKATEKFRDGRSATCTTGCRPCQGGFLLVFSLIIIYGRLWRIKLDELRNGARRINGESFTCKGQ
ncbi:uncharacterized protein IWZ02DRAFT_68884 [Phyllosticta citriasiana]|uniref:uncharacterized protein n=1 Tax=Phyllosticta citriasiana TaxID=595635 RepID=UPI0030FD396C